jgi:hypothetical protein
MSHHSWVSLAEHDAHLSGVLLAALVGDKAVDDKAAFGRDEDAGQHLDRGRLAGAVGTEVSDGLTGFDAQVDVVHGQLVAVLAREEMLERTGQAGFLDGLAELLGEPLRFDQRHGGRTSPGAARGDGVYRNRGLVSGRPVGHRTAPSRAGASFGRAVGWGAGEFPLRVESYG